MYTIDEFWIPRLGQKKSPISMEHAPTGWTADEATVETFVEAPLELAEGFGENISAPVYLVSAPGAVGKSTLARQISALTGAVLVDLAKADAVGDATITGGLAWAGIFDRFRDGGVGMLIDGLDEARIRVTKDSFAAFLQDLCRLANSDCKPITLLGRTSAIEDAWLDLKEMGVDALMLEIQFHETATALEFVKRQAMSLRRGLGEDLHAVADADGRAAELILAGLEHRTEAIGTKFSGYAPVLIAVARRIASERNPMALVQELGAGVEAVSLRGIVGAILEREKSKLERLQLSDLGLRDRLYGKEEQVDRLVSAIYDIDHVPTLPAMSERDAEIYRNALEGWVPDHPFTDGSGKLPSSEVFGGFIIAEALKRDWASGSVRARELGSAKVNPFMWEFRLPDKWRKFNDWESEIIEGETSTDWVPMSDLGLVFASIQAQLPRSGSAHLYVDAEVGPEGGGDGNADVEIDRFFDDNGRWIRLGADCHGPICFGSRVSDVDISGNALRVVASGGEVTFTAPVELDVHMIEVGGSGIVVEGPPPRSKSIVPGIVHMRCTELDWRNDALSVRAGVDLAVDWPGSESFPWHTFRKPQTTVGVGPEFGERLRRLRKILVLFRSGGKGQLAKYKEAIDAGRRSRGSGAAVRDLLLEERVLYEKGRVYVLDTDRLSEVLGLSFQEIRSAAVNAKTIDFLRRVEA